jgi:protein-S-isoprenylcysteine O-methyltransferase Ste14
MGIYAGDRQARSVRDAAIRRRAVQVLGMFAVQGLILFLAAGRLDWFWGWLYVGLYLAGIAVTGALMFRYSPETIAERADTGGVRGWDRVVGGLFGLAYFIGLLLVAGLDARYRWTPELPLALHLLGVAGFLLGLALFVWAMLSNARFATVARLRRDGEHAVCSSGPYRFVRHPGYSGAILQSLATPLFFGSLWAFVPGLLSALLLIARTALEDRMLQAELAGYPDYARRVRYRLLPPIW